MGWRGAFAVNSVLRVQSTPGAQEGQGLSFRRRAWPHAVGKQLTGIGEGSRSLSRVSTECSQVESFQSNYGCYYCTVISGLISFYFVF